jgi:hypothetical protein
MSDDPIKITVYLTPEAYKALNAAADREGLTRTDALNRAVLAWDQVTAKPGQPFAYEQGGAR